MAADGVGAGPGRVVAVGAVYGALAFAALSLTRFGAPVEAIWLSNAVLVWALVAARKSGWPWLIAAGAAGHVFAHMTAGDTPDMTGAYLIGDMSECVLAAWLLQRRPQALTFQNRNAVLYFLAVCGAAPLASTLITSAAAFVTMGEPLSRRDMLVWFSADALGLIVFLPILYAIAGGRWRDLRPKLWRVALAAALIPGIAAVGTAFDAPVLRFLVMPLFVLVAFYLGVAATQICLAVAFVTWSFLSFIGLSMHMIGDLDMRDSLLFVQVQVALFAVSFLPLAVVIEQKQRLTTALSETIEETREAWGAILAGEARYRLVVENVPVTVMRIRMGGEILFASPACSTLLHADRKFEGRNILDLLHPEDRAWVQERTQHTVRQRMFNLPQRWRVRIHGDDDQWYAVDARVTLLRMGRDEPNEFIAALRSEYDDDSASAAESPPLVSAPGG
jgi:PAS domain S-box-containing protein